MVHVRIPDELPEDSRWERHGADALGLHVAALCYSNRTQADGLLTRARARLLLTLPDPDAVIDALLSDGTWVANGDDLRIVLSMEHQFTKQQVLDYRKAEREKKANWRASKQERERRHAEGDHTACSRDYCPNGSLPGRRRKSTGDTPGTSTGDTTGDTTGESRLPSHTTPSQPDPRIGVGLGVGVAGDGGSPSPPPRGAAGPHPTATSGFVYPNGFRPPARLNVVMVPFEEDDE